MMFWWILLSLILFLVITLLFAPIRLCIHTPSNVYFVSWGDVLKASVIPVSDDIEFRIAAFGLGKRFSLLKLITKPKKEKEKKPKKKKKKRSGGKLPGHLIRPVLRSFKVKRLYADLDFNNVFWNSWLYPWGQIFQRENIQCTTNFEGREVLILEVVNRPFWLVQQLIRQQLKS